MSKTGIYKRRVYLTTAALWLSSLLVLSAIFYSCNNGKQEYTRGAGIYPGRPSEISHLHWSPEIQPTGIWLFTGPPTAQAVTTII